MSTNNGNLENIGNDGSPLNVVVAPEAAANVGTLGVEGVEDNLADEEAIAQEVGENVGQVQGLGTEAKAAPSDGSLLTNVTNAAIFGVHSAVSFVSTSSRAMITPFRRNLADDEVPYDVDSPTFQAVIGASDQKIDKIIDDNPEKIKNCKHSFKAKQPRIQSLEDERHKVLKDEQAKVKIAEEATAHRISIEKQIKHLKERSDVLAKSEEEYAVQLAIAKDIRGEKIDLYSSCSPPELHRSTGFHNDAVWNGAALTRLQSLAVEANRCGWLENANCPIPSGLSIHITRRRVTPGPDVGDQIARDGVADVEDTVNEDVRESTSSYRNYVMWALRYPGVFDMPQPTIGIVALPSVPSQPNRSVAPADSALVGIASRGMAARNAPEAIDTASTDAMVNTMDEDDKNALAIAQLIYEDLDMLGPYKNNMKVVAHVVNLRKRKHAPRPSPRFSDSSPRFSDSSPRFAGQSPRFAGPSPRFAGPSPLNTMGTIAEEVDNRDSGFGGGNDAGDDNIRPMKKPRGNPKDPSNYH